MRSIKVVNIIPQSLSGETNQDSEPNIAVNPNNPLQIAASAFTPNPMGGANAPIYISTDGGNTWSLNSIVPGNGSVGTGDITLKFAGSSNRLFTSILGGVSGAFEAYRTTNFTSATTMTQLEKRSNEDQPYVQAITTGGKDQVYIGVNDFNASGGKTATMEQTLDGGTASPAFSSIRLEKRVTSGQNGPQVRPAIHADGTVYAAFYRWISSSGSFPANTLIITNADAIVVRDDNWGSGGSPFTALKDSSDNLAGRRVATGLSIPFNQTGVNANGQERWGGDLSIAVDPTNSSVVYLVYATRVGTTYTLNVVRSRDRGVTWSGNLLSISNATNPAISINSAGKVGMLYQQITGTGTTQRWETHFRDTLNGRFWTDTILCTALSQTPTRTFSPYIGDYLHMMAFRQDFYGIFSANNTPDPGNFPQGVTYQRNHDFVAKRLLALNGVSVVATSIDPFFCKISELGLVKRSGDFDGDGIAEILVSSPWGIGILKRSGATMIPLMMQPNGTRFGGWLLNTGDNTFGEIADFDGDGHDEVFISSPWGIGILKLNGTTMSAPMMQPNGTRFGGWLLNTKDNSFGPAADYDGDGKAEIFVKSPWGVGILKMAGATMTPLMMAPNGTRFGGWLLNTGDNDFGPAADFDGDHHAELFISSPWGIGILKLVGGTLTAPMMQPNGTRFGGWLLNTGDNTFGPAADYDGDGIVEILVTSPWGIGILKQAGASMTPLMMAPNGTRFGGWLLSTVDNDFGAAGDFDGDGHAELLVTSPWGIGFLKLVGGTLTAPMMQPNGTRFGGWLLNTADNQFGSVGKYIRGIIIRKPPSITLVSILVTSPWGVGILQLSGATLSAPMMQPNGTRFGGWLLNTADNVF
ncbi:MAG: VCBS repeat-containing protein [Ginsengibacter sp.]